MSQRFLVACQFAVLGVALSAFPALGWLQVGFCAKTQDPGGTASATQSTAVPQNQTPPNGSEPKKSKKVWTNDDLGKSAATTSSFSVDAEKSTIKPTSAKFPGPQYAASLRKQIDLLQKRLGDIDQQLTELKKFKSGESVGGNMQLHKRYNTVPIEEQINDLQEKKKRTQGQLDTLFDDARKKGIEPGQLR